MHRPVSRYRIAGSALAVLARAGRLRIVVRRGRRGAHDGSRDPQAAAKDKGPVCVGEAPQDGVHVLRGGGFQLPGGVGVQYTEAQADGTTRKATLREGDRYQSGQRQWTVEPGGQVTVSDRSYTVRQICSYRVVLEPKASADKAALAAAPKSMEAVGGPADAPLCFTTNPEVLAAAAAGFPAEGEELSLVGNGGVQRFPTGLSLTVSYLDTDEGTAEGIAANCAAIPAAAYEDVRVGDPVEFAGVVFEVSDLTEESSENRPHEDVTPHIRTGRPSRVSRPALTPAASGPGSAFGGDAFQARRQAPLVYERASAAVTFSGSFRMAASTTGSSLSTCSPSFL